MASITNCYCKTETGQRDTKYSIIPATKLVSRPPEWSTLTISQVREMFGDLVADYMLTAENTDIGIRGIYTRLAEVKETYDSGGVPQRKVLLWGPKGYVQEFLAGRGE